MNLSLQLLSLLILGVNSSSPQKPISTNCPLLGPVFPAPTSPSTSPSIQEAQSTFSPLLLSLLRTGGETEYGLLDTKTTSFSITIFSAHDDNSPLFTYHHEAPGLNGSLTAGRLDDDTLYRIGSLSKLLTVYTLLAEVGDGVLDEKVVRYVPELADDAATGEGSEIEGVRWGDVTIGALGSHLAGVLRDYNVLDVANLGVPVSSLGLPVLDSEEVPRCGLSLETPLCSRKEFLKGITAADPFKSTFSTPLYSNAAIQILAYALEGMTNRSFADSFNSALVKPLNLSRTFLNSPPDNTNAIIPGDALTSLWGFDIGDETPAGGMYSSMADIATIGRSILRSSLLDPATTRKWMKPQTHTSSLYTSIGMPWEIQRMELPLTPGSKTIRIVDLYTKSGNLGAYGGQTVLSPDHDIGFSVYAAGASAALQSTILADVIAATWIPAFEAAAREQAQRNYAGTYASADTSLNSSITIAPDDRPGLGIESWISNGTDMLKAYGQIPTVGAAPGQVVSARLYPAGLRTGNQVAFRALFEVFPQPRVGKVFSGNCITWATAGAVGYGEVALGDFVVEVDETGRAVSVNPKALRVVLERES